MTVSAPAVLVAAGPTLYRAGLVALLRQQWSTLPLTLTANASQLVEFTAALVGPALPGLPEQPLA